MTPYDRDRVTLSQLVLEELAAMPAVLRVLIFGHGKYPSAPWRRQSVHEHIAHAREHISAWAAGNRVDAESGESNLLHATVRLLFACVVDGRSR